MKRESAFLGVIALAVILFAMCRGACADGTVEFIIATNTYWNQQTTWQTKVMGKIYDYDNYAFPMSTNIENIVTNGLGVFTNYLPLTKAERGQCADRFGPYASTNAADFYQVPGDRYYTNYPGITPGTGAAYRYLFSKSQLKERVTTQVARDFLEEFGWRTNKFKIFLNGVEITP